MLCDNLILDMGSQLPQGTLYATYGDTNRGIRFHLRRGLQDFPLPEDATAIFTACKSDGTVLYNDCQVADGDVFYRFTPQTTSCPGTAACELRIYQGQALITGPRFTLEVRDTVYHEGDALDSTSEAAALKGLYDRLQQALDQGEFNGTTPHIGSNGNWFVGRQDTGVAATGPKGDDGTVVGAAPATESTQHPGCYYRTVSGAAEWVNPPMVIGTEYRTTERYMGKVVYCKLMDGGIGTNGKALGIDEAYTIVRTAGKLGESALPAKSGSGNWDAGYTATKGYVQLTCTDNFSNAGRQWYQTIWYTKE